MNLNTENDIFFQYNFGKAIDGAITCGFNIMLTDSDQVTKLIQFVGTGGSDAFVMTISPNGTATLLDKKFRCRGSACKILRKTFLTGIDICVDSPRNNERLH